MHRARNSYIVVTFTSELCTGIVCKLCTIPPNKHEKSDEFRSHYNERFDSLTNKFNPYLLVVIWDKIKMYYAIQQVIMNHANGS